MRKLYVVVLSFCITSLLGHQTSMAQDFAYQPPPVYQGQKNDRQALKQVLLSLEKKFGIYFTFESQIIRNKYVESEVVITEDLDQTLINVLNPFNLKFKKLSDRYYTIYLREEQNQKKNEGKKGHGLQSMAFGSIQPLYQVSSAQTLPVFQFSISGTITDENGQTLPGANVIEKGTTNGTTTDASGNYTLNVENENTVLVFSFIGYTTQEVPVNGRSVIDVALAEDVQNLDEVVVIGYGTQKKSDLTGAVHHLDTEVFKSQSMTQVTDMLAGTVAGFYANQNPSAAGGSSLDIRGPTSLNASSEPLIVLDGVIYNGSLSDINPSDVQSIDILKDASSAAVFGARAAAGIIMITTTKGATGKPTISFSTQIGVAEVANDFKPYDAEGYLDFRRDVLIGFDTGVPDYFYSNPNELPDGISIEDWRNASQNPQTDNTSEYLSRLRFYQTETDNYLAGKSVDWYDQVMQSGLRQTYDLSIGGGSEKFTYYWSVGYLNNEGVVLGDKFSTIRTRLNVDFEVTDWLNVGINSQFADRDESSVPANLSGMFNASPYGSEYEADGSLKWWPGDYIGGEHPLLNYYGQDRLNKVYSLFASMYANIALPFGFDYKISFQPRYGFSQDYNFWPSEATIMGGMDHSEGYGRREELFQYERIIDNILHWKRQIGIHNFDVTLLYSSEQNQSWSSHLTNEGFAPNQNLGFNALQFGTNPSITNADMKITGDALMGRLNYGLLDKYLFTASIRRDGYSAFGQKNPRAVFPAAAFAWRISEEDFFKVKFLDHLKLRLSWGINGNREIGAYSALAQLEPNLYYDGSKVVVGVYNSSLANPGLVWEKTESLNVGVDFGLFQNRLDVSAEYYDMTTIDLLMNRVLPDITGFTDIISNLGELGNRGIEFTLKSVNISQPNFNWNTNLVFSMNRNKIKKLFGDYEEVEVDGEVVRREVPDYSNAWFPGEALDVVWDYDVTGVWQVDEDAAAAVYKLEPGDFKARDVNEDGVYEALHDKAFIGYSRPRYRLGLRNEFTILKNFTASFFIRADLGHLGEFREALNSGWVTYDKRNVYALPYWTPENPINDFGRLSLNTSAYGGGIMIYKPRSFVRIQDFSLSYNVPPSTIERLKLKNMRVFTSIRNVYSFDKWPGWDPESGNRPMPRTYTVGLNFSL